MVSVQTTFGSAVQRLVRKRDQSVWSRSRRRLYHRMMTGVKKCRKFHRQLWFITLTTSDVLVDVKKDDCDLRDVSKRQFSAFVKRCRRKFGSFEYIAVHTSEGNGVYHVLCNSISIGRSFTFGGYVGYKAFWFWVSEQWLELFLSPVVWTVLIRGVRRAVNYVISHYLGGQKGFLRYHWSWNWVFKGFIRTWRLHLRAWKDKDGLVTDMREMIKSWENVVYEKCLSIRLNQSLLTGADKSGLSGSGRVG